MLVIDNLPATIKPEHRALLTRIASGTADANDVPTVLDLVYRRDGMDNLMRQLRIAVSAGNIREARNVEYRMCLAEKEALEAA